jgi:hypothetical protein
MGVDSNDIQPAKADIAHKEQLYPVARSHGVLVRLLVLVSVERYPFTQYCLPQSQCLPKHFFRLPVLTLTARH